MPTSRRKTPGVRPRLGRHGWLSERTARGVAYWCDLCQIGDAMFASFVDAIASRLPHRRAEIETWSSVRGGRRLDALCAGAAREDTGLRVLDRPVWRVAVPGRCLYVCEVKPHENVLLVYEPEIAPAARKG